MNEVKVDRMKLMHGLDCCASPTMVCSTCPYNDTDDGQCIQALASDARAYIRERDDQIAEIEKGDMPSREWEWCSDPDNPRRIICGFCGAKTAVRTRCCPHCGARMKRR